MCASLQPRMVIDTARNGAELVRSNCQGWCNLRGAGAGHVPTMNTGVPDVLDAFLWIKTPGESDGCTRVLPTGEACSRFDMDCESIASIGGQQGEPRAPVAGAWWDYQAREVVVCPHKRLLAARPRWPPLEPRGRMVVCRVSALRRRMLDDGQPQRSTPLNVCRSWRSIRI